MQIRIIASSLIKKSSYLHPIIEDYKKRFTLLKLNINEFEDKNLDKKSINQKILSLCAINSYKILLDEKGQELNSLNFARLLTNIPNKTVDFLIAGADGFTSESKSNADFVLSLSQLTFPHQLARLLLIEQLYRAQSIMLNHPYHRE